MSKGSKTTPKGHPIPPAPPAAPPASTVTANQGAPNSAVNAWPVTVTSGTISVGNFPTTQNVTGTVNINNTPNVIVGNTPTIMQSHQESAQGGQSKISSINTSSIRQATPFDASGNIINNRMLISNVSNNPTFFFFDTSSFSSAYVYYDIQSASGNPTDSFLGTIFISSGVEDVTGAISYFNEKTIDFFGVPSASDIVSVNTRGVITRVEIQSATPDTFSVSVTLKGLG